MDVLMAYYHFYISTLNNAAGVIVLKNSQVCSVADAGLSVAMENLAVKALLNNVYPPDLTYEVCTHMHTHRHSVILHC